MLRKLTTPVYSPLVFFGLLMLGFAVSNLLDGDWHKSAIDCGLSGFFVFAELLITRAHQPEWDIDLDMDSYKLELMAELADDYMREPTKVWSSESAAAAIKSRLAVGR